MNNRNRNCLLVAAISLAALWADSAQAKEPNCRCWGCNLGARRAARAYAEPWHGDYYHTMWGQPVALVVPPTAQLQTKWAWGVAQTRVVPIYNQFERPWPGPYEGGYGFSPTPRWPSNTDQFGVYYVRGPW